MTRITLLAALSLICLSPVWALAQGFVVPPDRIAFHGAYQLRNVTVDATIKDQIAQVQVSQVVRNLTSRQMEVVYVFPVPPDAVISQFMLMIDGKEVPAKLYSKEEARRIYEGIVRTKRDPALLEYLGYGVLQTSVFPLPPHGERKITLRYSHVCQRDRDVMELLLPVGCGKVAGQPIEELRINVRIDSPGRLKSVYSPVYAVNVERPDEHSAIIRYTQNNQSVTDDFRLIWTTSDQRVGVNLISYKPNENEDGYFLLLASPEVKAGEGKIANKTIVFALDRSGSMAGQKIEQARNALKFVLNNLRDGDLFNIIAYDDRIETFRPELQRFDSQTRQEAIHFVEGIRDGGSTNIDGALGKAFGMIGNTGRPSYIIFLTDGLPTAGEQNEAAIAANAKSGNRDRARLYAFGVGYDVNARLLDRLTTENRGTSEYVRPNENIEASVSKFYSKMNAPVLTGIRLEMSGAEVSRVYPRDFPDLFAGGQLVIAGRYRNAGSINVQLSGRVGDVEQIFTSPVTLAGRGGDDNNAFVEKLWATRRVGDIINDLDLKGRNQELIDELVRLSTRYGILTPYTAFLADERVTLHAVKANAAKADDYLFKAKDTSLGQSSGGGGVNLRLAKQQLAAAPQPAAAGAQSYMDNFGAVRTESRVQVAGNKAMYMRSNRWADPTVTPEDEKSAIQVEQFSDTYFELARNNTRLRQYLAMPEGCTVRLDGKVYQINPSQKSGG